MALILALDLATSTGWAAGSGEKSPELGSVRMPDTKEEVGPFLDFFDRWLNGKITELMIEHELAVDADRFADLPGKTGPRLTDQARDAMAFVVVIEAPILPQTTSLATTRKLQGLAGVAEMVCYRRNVPIREVGLSTVKKELSGSGRGGKPDMMAAARRCGLQPSNFDEADALGVWLVSVRFYSKAFAAFWDQKLWSQRGGLPSA